MQLLLKIRRFMKSWTFAAAVIVCALIFTYVLASSTKTIASPVPQALPTASEATSAMANANFLPIIAHNYNSRLSKRIGYGATTAPISRYADIRSLNAGWYVDWTVKKNPVRPSGMEYAQMVRVHQDIVETNGCGKYVTADRQKCPYKEPHSYTYEPDAAAIQAAAVANPGSIWIIGNEPDRLDWNGYGQDEMLPELYAVAYKEIYDLIKAADPKAKVAIAGVIQATPMRLNYLTLAWDEYRHLYGTDMPVDIWNVHNFVLAEICIKETVDGKKEIFCYGAGSVPGSSSLKGSYIGQDWTHIDHTIFDQQIRAFRQWMKDRGQEAKPLIVSEYGVLYTSISCSNPTADGCNDANWVNLQDPQVVQGFMLWTFDYFLNTKDCTLSQIDDCRLVQRWLWFSLDHEDGSSNPLTTLMDRNTRLLLPAGVKFREYTDANYEALSVGY